MASNIEGTSQMIKPGFQSCRPRMRFMKPPKAFHFRIPEPEPEPEECDLMDKDELYAHGYKPIALSCSEIKPCSPCEASSSTEGSCALHSVCGSCSTPSLDDDDDEGESHELDEINSPQSDDSGSSIYSPSHFDSNLCLRMAREPAMNTCGHLFCANTIIIKTLPLMLFEIGMFNAIPHLPGSVVAASSLTSGKQLAATLQHSQAYRLSVVVCAIALMFSTLCSKPPGLLRRRSDR
ncbi:PREDICTED: LON peptidase N-terminal domain and RING [Prunus dulcis]|uniref:PREDICTED: LON peptidase N-terminal domain and RING n=1 Tax=Prunus dulcis TaxID=3755 RepID=A0A5E4GCD3_PRUDU|nr:PREDICTED: LON peptidase N-terminal domain and RING [Prunus dulcis]